MRTLVLVGLLGLLATPTRAWKGSTHQRMTGDALTDVAWLDGYRDLRPTPFAAMVKDVLGEASPVPASAFRFPGKARRREKRDEYLRQTERLGDPALKQLARHLLLGDRLSLEYRLGEDRRGVDARRVLVTYVDEPDRGMDGGLDVSLLQRLVGGKGSKQFRHMSLFPGVGEAPRRSQLYFDLGLRAIQSGHAYWGFRFLAWGLHYVEDMGFPGHATKLPSPELLRGGSGSPRELAAAYQNRNFNYRLLNETYVDWIYNDPARAEAKQLTAAVRGGKPGALARLLRPRSMASLTRRRSLSALSAPALYHATIELFTRRFLDRDAPLERSSMLPLARAAERPRRGESASDFARRQQARSALLRITTRQLERNGVAVRQAMDLVASGLERR